MRFDQEQCGLLSDAYRIVGTIAVCNPSRFEPEPENLYIPV